MYELLLEKFQIGDHSEVISLARSSNITPVNDPQSSSVFAASLFSIGKVQESLEILVQLEESLGDDDNFLSLYGAALRRSGDLQASSLIFQRALAQAPDNYILQNNYANLLIDLSEYKEAHLLLQGIVSSHPAYQDAVDNLRRLELIISTQPSMSQPEVSAEPTKSNYLKSLDVLLDPLLMAFDADEVKEYGRLGHLSNLKKVVETTDSRSIGLEKLKLANKAISEGNTNFAFELCSQSYKQLGCQFSVFDCVSDAYLKSGRYFETEISILHALVFSGPSIKHYINLCSLASMRADFNLAEYYYQKAVCLDSGDSTLVQLRESLDKRKASVNELPFDFAKSWESDPLTQGA